jgi:hypothetical protein
VTPGDVVAHPFQLYLELRQPSLDQVKAGLHRCLYLEGFLPLLTDRLIHFSDSVHPLLDLSLHLLNDTMLDLKQADSKLQDVEVRTRDAPG